MQRRLEQHKASTISRPVRLRQPSFADGAAVHALIARCPPLDVNSLYCNLLQCLMFSTTSVLAEQDAQVVGFVSAFSIPEQNDNLFIWQVAVAPEARGAGLGRTMIRDILSQPACARTSRLQTTITPGNLASWALFGSLAKSLNTDMGSRVLFDRKQHLNNQHDTEMLVTIGPFQRPLPAL